MVNDNNTCPVCGFMMQEPPRDYNICPCCGTEFGHHDLNASIADLRKNWLKGGAAWWSSIDLPPANWDPYEQLTVLFEKPIVVSSALRDMIAGAERNMGSPLLFDTSSRAQSEALSSLRTMESAA